MTNNDKKTHCVACKSGISPGASICPICKSYQKQWKNILQYVAGIVTLFVLTLSASAWLVGKIHKAFFIRDNVQVVGADTLGSAVVVNRGETDVFVSHLLMWMPGRKSDWLAPDIPIMETIAPGHFVKHDYSAARITSDAEFVRGSNPSDFEQQIKLAVNGDPCYELAFFTLNDSKLAILRQMAGPNLNTFEVAGLLEYWGYEKEEPTELPITGVGLVRHDRKSANCRTPVSPK